MTDILIGAIKLGFLGLLWLFVLFSILTVKTDLFGHRTPSAAPQKRFGRAPVPTKLRLLNGPHANSVLPISGEIRIGRSPDCQLVLNDEYISTNHARLFIHDRDAVLVDLGSTNGTFVNEERITVPTPVTPADMLRIGRTQMQVEA